MGSKKKKKKEIVKKDKDEVKSDISPQINKLDALLKIQELKNSAQNYKMEGNYEEAINTADQIIRLVIKCNMTSHIKEQEEFINSMAEKVQKDFIISKIKGVYTIVKNQYEKLIKENNIMQAHALIKGFKKNYNENSYFESIQIVQDLIAKDNKIWLDYQIKSKDTDYQQRFKDEKDEIEQIIKALSNYYDELITNKQANEGSEIIKDFIKKYEDNSVVMSFPSVQRLIAKEKEVWNMHFTLNT